MKKERLISQINSLRKEKEVTILAHYYTDPDIQEIADYVGDSLGLSQMAAKTDAKIILFCGVKFMAETASIIAPDKKVLIPDPTAGCSLANSIESSDIIAWKEKNPNGVVVSYVNTTAEVKAYTDICCTSANAADVIKSIPKEKRIFFIPDKNLSSHIKLKSPKNIEIWKGNCHVHESYTTELVLKLQNRYPNAELLIHPESNCSHDPLIYNRTNAYILSTTGMVERAKKSPAKQFIVVTEPGVIHKMQQLNPEKEFISVAPSNECEHMKKNTLEKMYITLRDEINEIKVSTEIREKAYPSIEKMLNL